VNRLENATLIRAILPDKDILLKGVSVRQIPSERVLG
jgi:hypothetical protein